MERSRTWTATWASTWSWRGATRRSGGRGRAPCNLTQGLGHYFAQLAVRIVLHFAGLVEDHHRALLRVVGRPRRQPAVVRVAFAREVDPSVAYLGSQGPDFGAATSGEGGNVRVVEHEGDLGAMEGARPSFQQRRLPGEQVHVGGSGAPGSFAFGLSDRFNAHAEHPRQQLHRLHTGVRLAVRIDHHPRLVPVPLRGPLLHLVLAHRPPPPLGSRTSPRPASSSRPRSSTRAMRRSCWAT